MVEPHSHLERLEARIDDQTARIDALYALLEAHGIVARPTAAGHNALSAEIVQNAHSMSGVKVHARPARRPTRSGIHLGDATGV
jgi:gamma-glutamyl:cysteine ligase YbdK (ATP-grasp superfamily)